jgi:lipopolysaccharide export system permease protein
MIFKTSLRRDLASSAGLVFATLFTIMLTTTLIRMLGRAANGKVDTTSVLPLLAFSAINLLPVLLTLTLFIAIMFSLSRAYRDSEMVIWFASGLSLIRWIRPVMEFSAPIILLIGILSFFVGPWANRQASEYQQKFEQREDISQVAAGQFRESAKNSRVFFVESLSADQTEVRNVFVMQQRKEQRVLLVAEAGKIKDDGKERFLVLEKGRRYQQPDSTGVKPEVDLMTFETHGIRLESRPLNLQSDSAKEKSTLDLIRNRDKRGDGELLWRIGTPVAALLLAFLAIPLAYINPRVGRAFNLIGALLLFAFYNSMQTYMQALVASGKANFSIAVWLVHSLILAIVILMFINRMSLGGFKGLFGALFKSRSNGALAGEAH